MNFDLKGALLGAKVDQSARGFPLDSAEKKSCECIGHGVVSPPCVEDLWIHGLLWLTFFETWVSQEFCTHCRWGKNMGIYKGDIKRGKRKKAYGTPMVNDHYPYEKLLFHWEYTPFSDKPICFTSAILCPFGTLSLAFCGFQPSFLRGVLFSHGQGDFPDSCGWWPASFTAPKTGMIETRHFMTVFIQPEDSPMKLVGLRDINVIHRWFSTVGF